MNKQKTSIFTLCECGKHGRIITSDGTYGPEVFSKKFALRMLESGIKHKNISHSEEHQLKESIAASSLPSEDSVIEESTMLMVELWHKMKIIAVGQNLDPSVLHAAYDQVKFIKNKNYQLIEFIQYIIEDLEKKGVTGKIIINFDLLKKK